MNKKNHISDYGNKNIENVEKIFDLLSKNISNSHKLLLAVSGGSDSMFLAVLIYNFFVKNNLDLKNLHIVHCNHNTRKETLSEQNFVESFFEGLNLHISIYDQNKKTENDLRIWRYSEFQKIIDIHNIDFILTGHNLTDRVESTFMNMFRGAGLNGFLSMKTLDTNSLLLDTKILRPLLLLTKTEIEDYCQNLSIPFVLDQTNLLAETSLRNKIRLELFPEFQKLSNHPNMFFDSIQKIYSELENLTETDISLLKIEKSDYWNSDYAFLWDIALPLIDKDLLLKILKKLNISSNITDKTLSDFVSFFSSSKQGYKYINGVYFFLSHGKIYIIKAKRDFWQKTIEKSLIIGTIGELEIGKKIIQIQDPNLLGLEIRYPKTGDEFASKSWSKYCINQKIPIFWRNFIPVVVKNQKIIKAFIPKIK